jgi:hypothetical protein
MSNEIGINKDLYNNVMNQIKVYVIDATVDDHFYFPELLAKGNELEIMREAEKRGTVYSLRDFQDYLNNDTVINIEYSYILIR